MKEVGDRQRRSAAVERDGNSPLAGLDSDLDEILVWRVGRNRRWDRDGERDGSERGKEGKSVKHFSRLAPPFRYAMPALRVFALCLQASMTCL